MRDRFCTRLLHVIGLGILLLPALHATTAVQMDTADLTKEAETIVLGKCVSLRAVWEGRVLVTVATVTVSETLKGGAAGSITVALPGGVDANRRIPIAMTYPGAPTMQPDEEVLLFLTRDSGIASGQIVAGFAQGKFSIVSDPQNRKYVSRDLTQLNLVSGPGIAKGTRTLTPLSEFTDEVKKVLGGAQ